MRMITLFAQIATLADFLGRSVTLKGWVANKRSSGKIAFLELRDGSGFAQMVVVQKEVAPETWELVNRLTLESSIICTGTVTKHPKQELYELATQEIRLVQLAEEYPI